MAKGFLEDSDSEAFEQESEELRLAIGQQIRRMRRMQHLRLEEVAQRTGLSRSTLSQMENGNTSLNIVNLLTISRFFHIDIALFFQKQDIVDEVEISRKSKRNTVYPKHVDPEYGGYTHENTGSFVAQGTVETFEVTIQPIAPEEMQFNTHAGMERAYILDGNVELVIKRSVTDRHEYRTELHRGDVLSFPAKYPHVYRATGDEKVRLYVELFFTPGQSLSESYGETLVSGDSSAK